MQRIHPAELNTDKAQFLGNLLLCLYQKQINYVAKGLGLNSEVSIDCAMLIRQREHHPGEYRVEVIEKEIGDGSSGRVYAVSTFAFKENNELYLKRNDRVLKVTEFTDYIIKNDVFKEYKYASGLFGRGAKKPITYNNNGKTYFGRIERKIGNKDLFDCLANRKNYDTQQRLMATRNLLSSLFDIHLRKIKHLDIKPENIRTDCDTNKNNPNMQFIDFGFALDFHEQEGAFRGTPIYMSPEQFNHEHTSAKSDIYSLGTILGLIWNAKPHPADHINDPIEEFIIAKEFSQNFKFKRLFSFNHDLSNDEMQIITDILLSMVNKDPNQRIELKDAIIKIERILLERSMVKNNDNEKKAKRAAYEAAVKARNFYADWFGRTIDGTYLKGMDNCFKMFMDIIDECVTDKYVDLFVDTVGVRVFKGINTVQGLKQVCQQLFADFKKIEGEYDRVNELADRFSHVKISSLPMTVFHRKIKMPMTLDYLNEYNRKCFRDFKLTENRLK